MPRIGEIISLVFVIGVLLLFLGMFLWIRSLMEANSIPWEIQLSFAGLFLIFISLLFAKVMRRA